MSERPPEERLERIERRLERLADAIERSERTGSKRDERTVEEMLSALPDGDREVLEKHRFKSRYGTVLDEWLEEKLRAIEDEAEAFAAGEAADDDDDDDGDADDADDEGDDDDAGDAPAANAKPAAKARPSVKPRGGRHAPAPAPEPKPSSWWWSE